jgi:serine/threonine protein kinase
LTSAPRCSATSRRRCWRCTRRVVTHGALCPANIWLEQKGEHLVPHLRGLTEAALWPLIPGLASQLTAYLAPELRDNQNPHTLADTRADIYAFGVSLFEALSGQRPDSVGGVFDLSTHLPNANADLGQLIRQSTHANRDNRFQSVMALRNILHEISIEGNLSGEEKRPERPEIGDLIAGQYRVEGLLGEGGMARVYKARDTVMNTQVAVKLLNATCLAEPEVVNRFIDEASIQAQLVHPEPHPNIVAVHRVLREMPVGFVMEFVPGKTLDTFIGNPNLSLVDWIEMFAQICSGLHHAHAHRIIHRDLKPSNISGRGRCPQ